MKNKMTLDQHKELGTHIRFIHEQICHISVLLSHHYPLSNLALKNVEKVYLGMQELKNQLDNQVFRDHYVPTMLEVETNDLKSIYYGAGPKTDFNMNSGNANVSAAPSFTNSKVPPPELLSYPAVRVVRFSGEDSHVVQLWLGKIMLWSKFRGTQPEGKIILGGLANPTGLGTIQ